MSKQLPPSAGGHSDPDFPILWVLYAEGVAVVAILGHMVYSVVRLLV